MTLKLQSTKTTSMELPPSAWESGTHLTFLLGRISVAYENRAWARTKVKSLQSILNVSDAYEKDSIKEQLKDREQVLLSMERYYKKLRCEFRDKYPDSLNILESMIPGSSKGLETKTSLTPEL